MSLAHRTSTAFVQMAPLAHSDAALLGFVVTGKDAKEVKEGARKALEALRAGPKGEEVKRAVAKARFAAAAAVDGRSGRVVALLGWRGR